MGLVAVVVVVVYTVPKQMSHMFKHTHTYIQPFYSSLDFVRDNLGEPVPEEKFTHSHPS